MKTSRYDMETVSPELWQAGEVDRDRHNLFDVTSGVLLPGSQALLTGVFLAGAVIAFCWVLKVPDFWKWGVVTLASVQAFAWLVLLGKWLNLTTPIERLLNVDLNNDGAIGEPETIRVELQHDARRTQYFDLPFPDRLPKFCDAISKGFPMSESSWTGSGALFSKREFFQLRDALLKAGVIEWRNPDAPAQGLQVTAPGRSVMRYLAHPPTGEP